MENIVQQYILDKLYALDESKEEELFDKCAYLFEKNVAIDLMKEFAHQRKSVTMETYLNAILDSLIAPLENSFSKEDVDSLRKTINTQVLNKTTLKGIDSSMSVNSSFSTSQSKVPLQHQNRETTRFQHTQQQRVSEKLKLQVTDQENLNQYLSEVESRKQRTTSTKTDTSFKKEVFLSENFGKVKETVDVSQQDPCFWSLNDALTVAKSKPPSPCHFEKNLIVTSNAAMVKNDLIDLIGPYRKKPWSLLVICDEINGQKTWKIALCSIKDTIDFKNMVNPENKLPSGRTMWLMRGNGKLLAGPGELNIDQDPKLALTMTQSMFFAGDYETLSYAPWRARFEKWMNSLDEDVRSKWITFFEKEILMGSPPGYASSPLYEFLHPKVQV